jgi:hypothetical protein
MKLFMRYRGEKSRGLVFKIDYEKAYDKVNLDFYFEVLELRGFSHVFVMLIKQITQGCRRC